MIEIDNYHTEGSLYIIQTTEIDTLLFMKNINMNKTFFLDFSMNSHALTQLGIRCNILFLAT